MDRHKFACIHIYTSIFSLTHTEEKGLLNGMQPMSLLEL